jgi:hypothetical protein
MRRVTSAARTGNQENVTCKRQSLSFLPLFPANRTSDLLDLAGYRGEKKIPFSARRRKEALSYTPLGAVTSHDCGRVAAEASFDGHTADLPPSA